MSHFTVLVIGKDPEKQLQPFHEYECTGIEDEYVIDVDKTAEVTEWLNEERWVGKSKETGALDDWSKEQAKEKLHEPKPMTRLEFFTLTKADIDNEISEWFNFKKGEDGKWFRHTNPNAKWDWYELGGRWTGFFKMKTIGTDKAHPGHKIGRPGLMTPAAEAGFADQLEKRHIDIEGMRNEAREKATKRYELVNSVIGNLPANETWDKVYERLKDNSDEARKFYWSQPRCKAWKESKVIDENFGLFSSPDGFLISQEEYVQKAADEALTTFAVIKDGKWYEKGKMGWWAMVSNKKEESEWNKEFNKLFDEASDDTLFSIYDCHI